jgi:leucyl aminopeptidase (aminopeptidase T)
MVSDVADVKQGESVCVVADSAVPTEFTKPIIDTGERVGAEIHFLEVKQQDIQSPLVLQVLSRYDVIFVLSTTNFGFNSIAKLSSTGSRVAAVPYIDASTMKAILVDYEKMREEGRKLGRMVTKGREMRITSPLGSDLVFSVHGEKPGYLGEKVTKRGGYAMLPIGALTVGPVEDFGEGSLVIDGVTWFLGPVSTPFKLAVKRGRVIDIVGRGREASWMRDVLKPPFQNVNRLAEFLIGVNPKATYEGYMPGGEKVRGAVSMDIGYHSGEGDTEVGKHTDIGSVRNATLKVDDQTIVDRGKLIL